MSLERYRQRTEGRGFRGKPRLVLGATDFHDAALWLLTHHPGPAHPLSTPFTSQLGGDHSQLLQVKCSHLASVCAPPSHQAGRGKVTAQPPGLPSRHFRQNSVSIGCRRSQCALPRPLPQDPSSPAPSPSSGEFLPFPRP